MKRPAAVVGLLLASFPAGGLGRSFRVVPSYVSVSASARAAALRSGPFAGARARRRLNPRDDPLVCWADRVDFNKPPGVGGTDRRGSNKPPGVGGLSTDGTPVKGDGEDEPSKRGAFRRIRKRISTALNKKEDGDEEALDKKDDDEGRGIRERISTVFGRKGDDNQEGDAAIGGNKKDNDDGGGRIREKIFRKKDDGNKEGKAAIGDEKGDAKEGPGALGAARSWLSRATGWGEDWVVACPKTRVGPGQIVPCVVNGLDIVVFASRDGQRLDAFANACPHLGSPFDLATIERKPVETNKGRADDGTGDGCVDCIVCPVHRTAFEIQSGDVRGEWCPYPPVLGGIVGKMKARDGLVKFAVRLRGKNVEVRIATPLADVGRGREGADGMKGIK